MAKVSEAVNNIGIAVRRRYFSQIPPPVLTGSGSTGLLSAKKTCCGEVDPVLGRTRHPHVLAVRSGLSVLSASG
ncbi:hypothetical protein [Yersinia massiliensis]